MHKKILFFLTVFISTHVKSQITENFEPNFSKFNLNDFGFYENIKTITASFYKKDENGNVLPSGWKTIKIYLNFDEKGKLISEYGVNHDNDTCKITFYFYNTKNQLQEVKYYETGIFGRYSTKDLRNWEYQSAKFEYDPNGHKIKMIRATSYSNATFIYYYNLNDQLIKEVVLDNSSETNSTLNKTEYTYNDKNELIQSEKLIEDNPNESGFTNYSYKDGKLSSKIFTRYDGIVVNSTFFPEGKINSFSGSDTIRNYDKKIYNEKGLPMKSFHHYDGDGEFKSFTNYSYTYDSKNNLIEEIIIVTNEIIHSRETNVEEFYKTEYEITYY